MTDTFTHLVGLAGAAIYLLSYVSVQLGRLDGNGLVYTSMNTFAAVLVLTSLLDHVNLGSMVIQIAWFGIGLLRIASAYAGQSAAAATAAHVADRLRRHLKVMIGEDLKMIKLDAETALVTGSSRGIGRGIVLSLAERGVDRIAIHYLQNREGAEVTADLVRQCGADPLLVQGDVGQTEDIERMFSEVRERFGALDIFVHNARPDVGAIYAPVEQLTLDHWNAAMDTQARALLLSARAAASMMQDGGRIVAVTYGPGSQTGSWMPWAAMGPAKAAMESLCRYLAWAYAKRGITVNIVRCQINRDTGGHDAVEGLARSG